ncbi:Diaminohydroxyphosphoribosylaminopyrimidinedeaminase (EC 3.5.4.26) / 5-amino-6-(5-phosphoribosylamino)uracil reductase (EC 1.1.1.193), partial [Pseudomonas sp. FEN]
EPFDRAGRPRRPLHGPSPGAGPQGPLLDPPEPSGRLCDRAGRRGGRRRLARARRRTPCRGACLARGL